MSSPDKEPEQTAKKTDWLEFARSKIVQVTALVGAVVALVVAFQQGWEKIYTKPNRDETNGGESVVDKRETACVRIDEVKFPEAVAYSDWNKGHITVTGINGCNRELGLYVTFSRRVSMEPPRLVLRRPHDADYPECSGAAAMESPRCWDAQKPVPVHQGVWHWDFLLPPLSKIGEMRRTEELDVTWDVRDYDAPDKKPLATTSVTIKIIDDSGGH